MGLTIAPQEKTIFIIDSSQLNDWDLCHYKYLIRYKKYILPIRKERSLDMGTVLHEMLRVYYTLRKQGGLEWSKIVEACMKRGRKFTVDNSDLPAEDIAFLFKTFTDYVVYYKDENWIPLQVEKAFTVKAWEDENYIFMVQGKVDLIIRIPGLPDNIIVDHKKRSRIKSESGLDHQKIFYSKFLGIDTFIVNKIGFLKTKPPAEKFRRESISYTVEQSEEWFKEFLMTMKEMIAYEKLGFYKRNPTSCDKWAGCVYKQWCNMTPSRRESLIGETYRIGTEWDVSKHLEEVDEL